MEIVADLHNHSCLSPCGDLYASPSRLAERAAARGIHLMALTDHNSAANSPAFAEACRRRGMMALFGTETTSREEVHILSLFPTVAGAVDWGAWLYRFLPDFRHDPERFGDQVVVDVDENIIDFEERYLVPAVDLGIDEIVGETHRRKGLVIPAHIDRSANSIFSQLGFLPDLPYDALEITRLPPPAGTEGFPLICDSDAHFLDDVGRRTFSFSADISPASSQEEIFGALTDALRDGEVVLSIGLEKRTF